jgi:hypothetical protein
MYRESLKEASVVKNLETRQEIKLMMRSEFSPFKDPENWKDDF